MRIAVSATGPHLDDAVETRFGRCAYFIIVDPESMEFEAFENPNIALGGGAGIQSAQFLSGREVSVVLTGNCGPNAFQTLAAAGVEVIIGCSGTVSEVIERFKSGELNAVDAPNVDSHAGLPGGGGGGGRGRGW